MTKFRCTGRRRHHQAAKALPLSRNDYKDIRPQAQNIKKEEEKKILILDSNFYRLSLLLWCGLGSRHFTVSTSERVAAPVVEVKGKYLSPCSQKVQLRKLHLKSWWIGVCSLHNSLTQPIKTATKRHASSLITLFYGKITALSKKNLNYSLQNSYRQLLGFLGPFRCHKTVFSAILLCFSTFLLFKSLQITLNLNPPPPTLQLHIFVVLLQKYSSIVHGKSKPTFCAPWKYSGNPQSAVFLSTFY